MVLVLVEAGADGLAPSSAEALAFARGLAGSQAEPVEAVLTGDGAHVADPPVDGGPVGNAVDAGRNGNAGDLDGALQRFGVARCHRMTHPLLEGYSPECWGEALAQLVAQLQPSVVIAPASDRGTEIMTQAAARAGLPLAANCTVVAPADGTTSNGDPGSNGAPGHGATWTLTRVRNGGMLLEDATLTAPTALVTLAPGAAEPLPAPEPGAATVEPFTPELGDGFVHSRLAEQTTRGTGVSLATAKVVVSGGRGVGSADGFAPLEELAELAGGAVGCSRVVTNNGWRPHSDQVGQTGTKVNPDLYIACGISGATQHWVGCMGAKAILAINTDPEAPLVTRATYAVIGDVGDVVPAVVEEIRRRNRNAR